MSLNEEYRRTKAPERMYYLNCIVLKAIDSSKPGYERSTLGCSLMNGHAGGVGSELSLDPSG